jgi:hypothetical protein
VLENSLAYPALKGYTSCNDRTCAAEAGALDQACICFSLVAQRTSATDATIYASVVN